MKYIYVVDTETTTTEFNSEKYNGAPDGHIVELGVVRLNLETGLIDVVNYGSFNDNNATGNEWVYQNTDLPFRSAYRKSWKMRDTELDRFIYGKIPITAFNSDFDRTMIERDLPKFSEHLSWCTDIMKCADQIEDIPRKKHDTATGWRSFPSVQSTWDYLFPDYPNIEKHRALSDAIQEAQILRELIKMGLYRFPDEEVEE